MIATTPTPLQDRLTRLLAEVPGVETNQEFGGTVFRVHGEICCGVVGDRLLVHVGPSSCADALTDPAVKLLMVRGKVVPGNILLPPQAYAKEADLVGWVRQSVAYAEVLGNVPEEIWTARPEAGEVPLAQRVVDSPWIGILVQPRRTIRASLNMNEPGLLASLNENLPAAWIITLVGALLMLVVGAVRLFTVVMESSAWPLRVSLLISFIALPAAAWTAWITGVAFALRGKAKWAEMQALSLNLIPALLILVVWFALVGVLGILTGASYAAAMSQLLAGPQGWGVMGIMGPLHLWQASILVISFAEVNQFSLGRSAGALALGLAIFGVAAAVLVWNFVA